MEEMINASTILVVKPEEMRRLGTPRRKWNDNIKNNVRWQLVGDDALKLLLQIFTTLHLYYI